MAKCKTDIAQIYTMLQVSPGSWESYIGHARSVMTSIDAIPFMADPMKIEEQVWIIEGLQNLASQKPCTGDLSDIAYWCMRKWLVVLEHHPHHIGVLRGGPFHITPKHHRHFTADVPHEKLNLERTWASLDVESSAVSGTNSTGRGQRYRLLFQRRRQDQLKSCPRGRGSASHGKLC